MKISAAALKNLIIESLGGNKMLKERPWSVEYSFTLSGGTAEDSEGKGPDGFAVSMMGDSGKLVRVVVDSYWNPQMGDKSGNSLKIEIDGHTTVDTYVPTKFDDGKEQRLIISNAPVPGFIAVSHAANSSAVPVMYLVTQNPFEESEDVKFSIENLGNGESNVELTGFTNL